MRPLISIVVPVYKVEEKFLRTCIESIANQSQPDFELILVDDGSPDNCGRICDEYSGLDKRFKVIHKQNGGVSSARNIGIKNSNADWILFVDADDWLTEDAVHVLSDAIMEYSGCDIIQFRAYQNYIFAEKRLVSSLECDYIYSSNNADDMFFLYRNAMQPSNFRRKSIAVATSYFVWDKLYRKEFLINNKIEFPIEIKVSEDKVFYLNCLKNISSVVQINNFLYHYRANELSITHKYSDDLDNNRIQLLRQLQMIAVELDKKISDLQKQECHAIEDDLNDFAIVVASGVIVNKYYHPNSQLGVIGRWRAANSFLRNEMVSRSLDMIKVRELSGKNRIRVWLMKLKFYWFLGILSKLNRMGGGRMLSRK